MTFLSFVVAPEKHTNKPQARSWLHCAVNLIGGLFNRLCSTFRCPAERGNSAATHKAHKLPKFKLGYPWLDRVTHGPHHLVFPICFPRFKYLLFNRDKDYCFCANISPFIEAVARYTGCLKNMSLLKQYVGSDLGINSI